MTRLRALLTAALLAACASRPLAAAPADVFQFGVIGHAFKSGPDEATLKQAIRATNQARLAFVVATGIKAASEACSDKLYSQRKEVFEDSRWPLVVSLAASDWSACRNSLGRSTAIERLSRLREVYFADTMSLGERPLTLSRLSSSASFRSYAENAHWEYGGVLFATINLPANNNHFLPEAGRNSEFEDRLVANRVWIKRLFLMAERRKLDGLVLFSDGDVGVHTEESFSLLSGFNTKQDGFAGPRHQIRQLAKKFPGQVLLIDTQPVSAKADKPPAPGIDWHENLGHVSVTADWVEIGVAEAAPAGKRGKPAAPMFALRAGSAKK